MDNYWSVILILLFLLSLSAFFSASETALTAANRIRLKNQVENGDKKAGRALKAITNYDNSLSTLLISNNIVNIFFTSFTTFIFTDAFGPSGVGIATGITTVVVIIFGEVLPKSLANENAETFLKTCSGVLLCLSNIFKPIISFLTFIKTKVAEKLSKGEAGPSVTEQELMSIIDVIEDEGVMEEDEAELVQSAIEFNDISADEVLTPRVDIFAVSIESSVEYIKEQFLNQNFSRMPVYEGSIDKILGFISQKEFFAKLLKNEDIILKDLVKPCLYVPPKKRVITIMQELQKDKVHMAVVTDEYGGTLGIVTLEDILEELVGDIWDEHDEVPQQIRLINTDTYELMGEANIEDFFVSVFENSPVFAKEYTTISGYLMDKLNKVADVGDTYIDDYFEYIVTNVVDNRIILLQAKKIVK